MNSHDTDSKTTFKHLVKVHLSNRIWHTIGNTRDALFTKKKNKTVVSNSFFSFLLDDKGDKHGIYFLQDQTRESYSLFLSKNTSKDILCNI